MAGCAGEGGQQGQVTTTSAPDVPTTDPNAKPAAEMSDQELYEARCGLCHGLARNDEWAAHSWYDPKSWRVIVLRMKEADLAPITDEEAERIIRYLETTFPKRTDGTGGGASDEAE